jgi:nitroreductase
MPEYLNRYSTRSFQKKMPSREELLDILEAARFAPSCFNEQPWRFVIGWRGGRLHDAIFANLTEKNQTWNRNTPILLVLIANQRFAHNGKDNFWANFDLGTAWGFLQVQAQQLGIATHAMGGFRKAQLHQDLSLREEELPVAVVAMGYYGDLSDLSAEWKERDVPNSRRVVSESILAE